MCFGNALHPITDEYSPSHSGFQNVHELKWITHMREGFALVAMYGDRKRSAAAAARSLFFDVFGSDLGQSAMHEEVTVKIIVDPNQELPDDQKQQQ